MGRLNAKLHPGPFGLHLFERKTALNILMGEVRLPPEQWARAPRRISVALTNACDLACPYCYAMKATDLNRFLVVCALVSDLYCPGYDPRQSLEKNSNLARTAARYKVDTAKVAGAVRAELSKTKHKQSAESHSSKKPNTLAHQTRTGSK